MSRSEKNTAEKIKLFRSLFSGLSNVYGTYDPESGRSKQIKAPISDKVIFNHLTGREPYGVFLLLKDRTSAIVTDFDSGNRLPPIDFVSLAKHYGIKAYIERSKSKGYHVWIFFKKNGVQASKARMVVYHILEEIEYPSTEVFPKQDRLDSNTRFGNFINSPLFGALVPKGKTVFIDPHTFDPYPNQWEFLDSITLHSESLLDEIIELNNIKVKPDISLKNQDNNTKKGNFFSLPPCIQIVLHDGVKKNQRCTCFRLAAHFKRIGIPFDGAIALIKNWSRNNRPENNKRIITEQEIMDQTTYAYNRNYNSFGCESDEIKPFCQPECPLNISKKNGSFDTFQSKFQSEANNAGR